MDLRAILFPIASVFCIVAHAQGAPPADALRYHATLLGSPHNEVLFSRFYDAWIDAQPLDSLEAFLTARAKNHGGVDLVILARFQLRRGHADDALATLSEAVTAIPDDPALPLERAKILLIRLEFIAARADLEKVISGKNEVLAIEAAKLIGKSHLREGDPAAAILAWDKLLAKHPGDEDMLEDLVELAAAGNQTAQALAYADSLIAATTDPFKKTLRRISKGELLAASGENDKAIVLWSETLAQTGEGSWLEREIISRITNDFRRQDRVDSLSEKLAELAKKNPRRLLIHRELARLEAASGELDSAIGRFREVLRRSPGEAELREEFIRLLIDGNRFDDAAEELGKMIARSPADAELHLRMADLANRRAEADPDRKEDSPLPLEILSALEKAHKILGSTEPAGLRIAALMLGYGLEKQGEALLSKLAAADAASTAPAEALAAHFTRTERKEEALTLFEKIAKAPDQEAVLRATTSIASLGKPETAFRILLKRQPDFPATQSYLTALCQFSLAAKTQEKAIAPALDLVRLAKLPAEIRDAVKISSQVFLAAEKTQEQINSLTADEKRSVSRTCLLASLLESQNQSDVADALFEKTDDPDLLRFHASLLAGRNDLATAITVFKRLGTSDEGGKVSYFKELSELQLRAGQIPDALETLEQWRLAAPTDKAPWTIAAQLLRESGKHTDAMDMTRRALVRFSNDEDLSLSLARLLMETGENDGAEQIYWRLYDSAADPDAQSRVAALLSNQARQTGGTEPLKEKFLERARGNSRSLGPVLALVELARSMNDREDMREQLTRALIIQPGNIPVRLQLAELEQQSGDSDAQIEILNEGAVKDPKGQLRSALAQAYIARGDTMKGMRILRALAGERASDPRAVESAATSLATSGLIAEAIAYLQESLPDGGDWHSTFLLASLLQEDGRESEAVPLFITLLDAENDIPGLRTGGNAFNGSQDYYGSQSPEFLTLMELTQAAQIAAQQRDRRRPLQQPISPSQVRSQSIVRLAIMGKAANDKVSEMIAATKIPDLAFVTELIASIRDGNPDYTALLEKFPTRPGLFQLAMQNGGSGRQLATDVSLLKRMLATGNLDPAMRFATASMLINTEPEASENWDLLLSAATDSLGADGAKVATSICYQLSNFINDQTPPDRVTTIKEILLAHVSKKDQGDTPYDGIDLRIFALAGTRDQWIDAANSAVISYRESINKKPVATAVSQMQWAGGYGYYQRGGIATSFLRSNSLSLYSLPPALLQQIVPEIKDQPASNGTIPATELLGILDRFDSPLLRAWIAFRSGDEKAIEDTLSVTPPDSEIIDFAILRASRETEAKRFVEACRIYAKLRETDSANPRIAQWVDLAFIGMASELKPEQRTEFEKPLRAAFDALKPTGPNQDYSLLAKKAELLGFDDLVKIFRPASPPTPRFTRNIPSQANAPARIETPQANARPSSRRTASSTPIERFQEFAREGKNAPAARQLLEGIRKSRASGSEPRNLIRNLQESITPEIRAEMLSLADPGNTPGLTKRREYIDICIALGEKEKALVALEKIATERPFDNSISTDLAFLLPPAQSDRAVALLARSIGSREFPTALNSAHQRISSTRDEEPTFAFFELITAFLEKADPEKTSPADLGQMQNMAHGFFMANTFRDFPNLLSPPAAKKEEEKENPSFVKHAALARRLALAMLRHPPLAETGFRLLNAAWEQKPAEMDEWARTALRLGASLGDESNRYNYNNLPESSSYAYLLARLSENPPPADVFPEKFITSIGKSDPHLPTLITFLITASSPESIATLWDSGAMEGKPTPIITFFQKAALARIATTPKASEFFLARIRAITPEEATAAMQSRTPPHILLFKAALQTCATNDEEGIREICAVIANSITPSKNKSIPDLHISDTIQYIFQDFQTDPLTCIRIVRAFDAAGAPIQNPQWIQSCFRDLTKLKPSETVELFASLGFLEKAEKWRPVTTLISSSTIENRSRVYTLKRNEVFSSILRNFIASDSRLKLLSLLENRKPPTFGSLITAAALVTGSERERLTAAAFELAAPDLAKFSPERLEDFALMIGSLPRSANASLPPALRAKAKENNDAEVAQILKNIEAQFEEDRLIRGQSPLGNIDNDIANLAAFDLEKSTALFLKATDLLFESGSVRIDNANRHEYSLTVILQYIGQHNAETALRFYLNIISSPQGNRFGIGDANNDKPFLATIGDAFMRESNQSSGPKNFTLPWLAAQSMPDDIRKDALAAVACGTLYNGNSLTPEIAREVFGKSTELSIQTRGYAITTISIRSLQNLEVEARKAITDAFISLLSDPDLRPEFRTQIALIAARRSVIFLTDPAIAESIADIFSKYCALDHSAVNNISIDLVGTIGKLQNPSSALQHLKRIHTAFWENANSLKSGGHLAIRSHTIEPLFLTAIRCGDGETAQRLFPLVQPSLAGKIDVILSMILESHFDFAASLLPDDGTPYQSEYLKAGARYTPELEKLITAFGKSGVPPTRLLRLEIMLLRMRDPEGKNQTKEFTAERRKKLAADYLENPPGSDLAKLEILSNLATSTNPEDSPLEAEMLALAATLDPAKVLLAWDDRSSGSIAGLLRWNLLCKSAATRLRNGDGTGASSLCNALTEHAKRTNGKSDQALRHAHRRFITYVFPATCSAVSEKQTGGFAALIAPFADLTLELSKNGSYDRNQTSATLALCEFFEASEACEGLVPETIAQIPINPEEYAKRFAFPREESVFLQSLFTFRDREDSPTPFSSDFLTEFLTRPELSHFLIADRYVLDDIIRNGFAKEVNAYANDPPESFSQGAKAVLSFHHFMTLQRKYQPEINAAAIRECLSQVPAGKPWNHLRGTCKIYLIREMIRAGDKTKEALKLFDSILPEEISPRYKPFYENQRDDLKASEKTEN